MTENNERNDISIHSLRMEGDIYNFDNVFCVELFQSTPSAWRETWCYRKVDKGRHGRVISIHSLRMEGDRQRQRLYLLHVISIHSLRMEGDRRIRRNNSFMGRISIHSLRMEGDSTPLGAAPLAKISIHSLRMEGDMQQNPMTAAVRKFQSTPSAWRETSRCKPP